MRRAGVRLESFLFLLTCCLCGTPAADVSAQTKEGNEAAGLFQQGMKLRQKGDVAGACAKFRASLTLAPAVATLAKVGECDAKDGKIATALANYRQAKELNDADSNSARRAERSRELGPKIADLEARAPRMQITLASWPKALEVDRNGKPVPLKELGTFAEVDPGTYEIVATAPGYRQETTTVVIAERESKAVNITWTPVPPPVPTATASASASAAPPPAPTGAHSGPAATAAPVTTWPVQRTVGILVGGLGIGALGVAAGFGVATLDKVAESRKDHDPCPRDHGYTCETLLGEARNTQNIGFGFLGAGSALAVLGLVLVVTATPPEKAAATSPTPRAAPPHAAPPRAVVSLGPASFSVGAQW